MAGFVNLAGDRDVRPIRTDVDVERVLALLREASCWMRRRGVYAWNAEEISLPGLHDRRDRGELFGGFEKDVLQATMQVHREDPLYWPDAPAGEALYVHKIAVARRAAGTGWPASMLDHASAMALSRGARFLRLDTIGGPLVDYYVSRGFERKLEPAKIFDDRVVVRLERRIATRRI